jgi:MFS family permease
MLALFLIAFVDILSFGMIFPLLPDLKIIYNLNDIQSGYLVSSFAVMALIGSPIFGILSDKFGRKVVLAVPTLLAAVCYFLTIYATTFTELLILRSLTGFFTANFPAAFAAVADKTDSSNRFKAMGYLGIAFSLGFVIGPAFGGFLSNVNFDLVSNITKSNSSVLQFPFIMATLLSLISALLVIFAFKETLPKNKRTNTNKSSLLKQLLGLLNNKTIIFFTYLTVFMNLIFAALEVYLSLYLNDRFKLNSFDIGLYWAIFAVCITFSQMIGPRLFKTKPALMVGFITFGVAIIGLVFVNNYLTLLFLTVFFSFSLGIIFTSITAGISLQGPANQQGAIFGINQLFGNLGRVVGPYIIGLIYTLNHSFAWIALGSASLITVLFVLKIVKPKD